MSQKFSVTGLSTAPATLKPYACFKVGGTHAVRITQIKMVNSAATLSIVQLGYLNAVGTGTITSSAGILLGPRKTTSGAVLETAWATTAPTTPSVLFDTNVLSASIGTGAVNVYQYDSPIDLAVSDGLVFYNPGGSTAGALYITVEFLEG